MNIHRQGRDPLLIPRQTPWQRERARGEILPMLPERVGFFRRIWG